MKEELKKALRTYGALLPVSYTHLVANVVASMPDEMGQGLYYWEPICVPKDGEGGWSENMGLLDEKGTVLDGVLSFLFTRNDACPEKPAKIYEPEPMTVVKDEVCTLPVSYTHLGYFF